MKQEPELVSLRELLKAACEESVRREVDAYPTPKELKEKYPDTSEATRRTFAALGVERKALLRARRRSLHVVRKTLVAAVIVLSMLFATLMTNAEMRAAVVNTLIEWTENLSGFSTKSRAKGPPFFPRVMGPTIFRMGLCIRKNYLIHTAPDSLTLMNQQIELLC